MYELLTEYITECGCSPDTDLCWKIFGSRPVGSTGPFTFPVTLEISGEEQTFTNPNQVLPGGSNPVITSWPDGPREYAFIYTTNCPVGSGCTDSALFFVEVDSCCDGSVTISESDCELSSSLSSIVSPTYQWQVLQGGIWVNISGATSSTYTGEDNQTYRLLVTDTADGCNYVSNIVVASCPEDPCSVSVNIEYDEVSGDLIINYNITGTGTFQYQVNGYVNDNPNNCGLSGGVEIALCSGVLSPGIGSFTCTPPASASDECYRVVIFGPCSGIDYVLVPASAPTCSVSISQSIVSCTSTIEGPFDSTGSLGATLAPIQENTVWQELDWYKDLDECGEGPGLIIHESSFSVSGANKNSSQSYRVTAGYRLIGSNGVNEGVDGDYLGTIELRNNLGGQIFANIDPANLDPNYASGPGGSVNTDDLYFEGFINQTLANSQEVLTNAAYKALIINILSHEFGASPITSSSPTDLTPGDFWVNVTSNLYVGNPGLAGPWLNIYFLCKHNAVGLWCGAAATDEAKINNGNGDSHIVAVGDAEVRGFGASNVSVSEDTPCGNIFTQRYSIVPQDDAINSATTGYVNVVASAVHTDTDAGPFGSTNSPLSCSSFQLTANGTGTGTPSYVWSTGETDQTISVDSGTYSVTVTYPDGCVASTTITV